MAESPSELQAEVEKLERKHAENPEGRYFVPLANDYRKMGELERAEALLRAGLQKHPDYLSAHIVLGRCLADRGSTSEAADEFTYVLSMDPQNLIALRSLGELSAAEGRREDAGRWYRELLAVDPMNDDARRALAQLDAPEETAPEPETADAGAWWDAGAGADPDPGAGSAPEPAAATYEDETTGDTERPEWGDERGLAGEAAGEEVPAAGAFDGGRSGQEAYGEFIDIDTAGELESAPDAGGEQPEYGIMELHPAGNAHEDGEEDDEAGVDDIEPVEVVTETIAELYARQGLHDRAADVYRELIRRRGGDPALERRLEELEGAAAQTAPAADDTFAASFADGFADAPPTADAGVWSAVEEAPAEPEESGAGWSTADEEPAEEDTAGAWAAGFDEQAGEESTGTPWAQEMDEPADRSAPMPGEGAAPARTGGRTIGGYLSSLAAWSPGAASGPDETTDLGTAEMPDTGSSPAPDAFGGVDPEPEPFPWEVPGDTGGLGGAEAVHESEPEPEAEPARGMSVDPEASAEPESTESADQGFAVQPAAPASEDLTAQPDLEPEPAIELEDYFPADEAEGTASAGEAPSLPPEDAAGAPAAQADDDLESFQAWLRSLKR